MAGLLVGDLFRNCARAVPDRVAVVLDEKSLTFGCLDRLANGRPLRWPSCRSAQAIGPWCGARPTWTWSSSSRPAAKVGVVFVPVNPGLGQDEAEPIVQAGTPHAHPRGRRSDGELRTRWGPRLTFRCWGWKKSLVRRAKSIRLSRSTSGLRT